MADLDNTVELPGRVRWDASAGYTFTYFGPEMTAQLNVYNLLNTDYYDRGKLSAASHSTGSWTFLGSLRIEM
ncbi:MAG: TonB-dependent receptor [Nitrospira sp.]|nr:TonB-dependent receptor [Nitrospira sp.]